jgi:TctA family transporter
MYQNQYLVLSIGIESWFWTSIAGIVRFGIDRIAGTDGIGIDGIAGIARFGIDRIASTDGVGIESVGIGIGVLIWVEILLLPSIY